VTNTRQLVQKLWSYCAVLRDDGVSTLDYVQQLTFLLFLKMADEQTKAPWNRSAPVPAGLDWPSLLSKDGDELEAHYIHILRELGTKPGLLGQIFRKAQNKIQDPARLSHLIKNLIDKESWSSLDADIKGDAYEGLLDKGVAEGGYGAGQYFTPRALIRRWSRRCSPRRQTLSSTRPPVPQASCWPRMSMWCANTSRSTRMSAGTCNPASPPALSSSTTPPALRR